MTSESPPAFAFPVFLEVRGRRVFVAGGHAEADSKARSLAELGAAVVTWTPAGAEPFDASLLDGVSLAIVGTGDRAVDHAVAGACRSRGILVNTVDDIPWCDWSAPAILRRGGLTLAIGTGGVAPALAVRLRDLIGEELVGPEYEALLELFAEVRPRIMASGRSFRERRGLWYDLVDGPAAALLREGRTAEARTAVERQLRQWESGEIAA